MQLDNSTFLRKRKLRLAALSQVPNPVVMETHGGFGKLFASCYSTLTKGVVFEKDSSKADYLAQQRPTWSVYRCDVLPALRAGVGSHLPVNFLDLDPYGEPWPVIDAFFKSDRALQSPMAVVVNDGLRQKLQLQGAWSTHSMQDAVARHGNSRIFKMYKEICREMLTEKVSPLGYTIRAWTAYYCGEKANMTHFAAVLHRA